MIYTEKIVLLPVPHYEPLSRLHRVVSVDSYFGVTAIMQKKNMSAGAVTLDSLARV